MRPLSGRAFVGALLAVGAVAPTPLLLRDDSGGLADPHCSDSEKEGILRSLLSHASPITDVRASREYRQAMLLAMARRALANVLAQLAHPEATQ